MIAIWMALGLVACGGAAPPAGPAAARVSGEGRVTPRLPDPAAADSFLAQWSATGGFRAGKPTGIAIAPDGRTVLFLRSGARDSVRDLYALDVATGQERVLATAAGLLGGAGETLSPQERARRERLRLSARGITGYQLSEDGRWILIPLSGRLFVVAREGGAARELDTGEGHPADARFSPDASHVAFVRDGDLFVIPREGGPPRQLTARASPEIENGLPEFIAQEEMGRFEGYWWSPDSTRIVYQETDHTGVERLHLADPMHPERSPAPTPYPRAGGRDASVRLGIVGREGGETRWLGWDRARHPYLATVTWEAGAPLTVVVQDRAQRELAVLIAGDDGGLRQVHVERDALWLNLDQSVPRWIGGERFLWSTERRGRWELELRGIDGSSTVVAGAELGYRAVLHVDGEAGLAWIAASREPTEEHVVQVPLAPGGAPERITRPRGTHEAFFGRGSRTFVVRERPWRGAERWVVQSSGAPVEIRSVAEAPPFAPRVRLEAVGERRFRAAVIRPRDFVRGRRYPVLLSVYGGPGHPVVTTVRDRYLLAQWIADHGFVVAMLDGRGTPHRGREWERSLRGRPGDLPLEDQVAGLQALLARHPEMDGTRVGISGWSYGGYLAAYAVLRRPDVFHAAIAGAPVTDWADYDTHYTERYLGLPEEEPEAYRAASLLTHAGELQRPLLIVHGTVDDNVWFMHAVKLSDALFRAGRVHEFLPLSGFTHMVADPVATERLQERMLGFLVRHLQ